LALMLKTSSLVMILGAVSCTGLKDSGDSPDAAMSTGDDSLARMPKPACSTPLLDADIPALYPGFQKVRFDGPTESPLIITNLYRCAANNSIDFQLAHGGPQIPQAPSLTINNPTVTRKFAMQYIIEAVTVTDNESQPTLAGSVAFTVKESPTPLFAGLLMRRLPGGSYDIAAITSLAIPLPIASLAIELPFRVRFEGDPTSDGKMQWKLTIQDRNHANTYQSSYPIPLPTTSVSVGINQPTVLAQSRMTISDLTFE
jgi:hypothetical protein